MNKVVDYLKQYIGVISIVLAVCILLTYSLSYFKVNTESKRAAEMYIGELKYTISIDETSTNRRTFQPGETIVDIDITNQNEIKTYYKLLYSNNSNISASYFNYTKNTNEEVTSYKSPNDSIESKAKNSLKIKIMNNSDAYLTIDFKVSGGYITNTLADVGVPNTYTEITAKGILSENTYFCKTNNTLDDGIEYVNGQFTYGYRKQGEFSSSGLKWIGTIGNVWGVQLTDKTSTAAVSGKVCTYINNKPIALMNNMFSNSQATTIDVSNLNTSKVTDMREMFSNSQATTIDVSNFDTSNVTYMEQMFLYCKVTSLDLSSFDTSNVTNMKYMFNSCVKLNRIYASDKFNTDAVTSSDNMFMNNFALVGGASTKYVDYIVDKTYARIDGGTSSPGYFTRKGNTGSGEIEPDPVPSVQM